MKKHLLVVLKIIYVKYAMVQESARHDMVHK